MFIGLIYLLWPICERINVPVSFGNLLGEFFIGRTAKPYGAITSAVNEAAFKELFRSCKGLSPVLLFFYNNINDYPRNIIKIYQVIYID